MKPYFFQEKAYFLLFKISTAMAIFILVGSLVLLLVFGSSVLSWTFLTSNWQNRNIDQGGIFQAIVGSLYLALGVIAVSLPLGIGTAIFFSEYAKHNLARRMLQLVIRNLAGIPSVVYGLFGLAVFVNFFGFGSSLLAAILTLSAMTLPWIITASIEAFEAVPQKFRESSLALGATHWQTTKKIIFPAAIPGSITGSIIGIARALGETAPIIIVGATFFISGLPSSVFDKFMALPYHAFILATQHSHSKAVSYAMGTALILILLTFLLSLGGILVRYHYRSKRNW